MDENDNFESLRRLLSLKRHEVPPPGYFDSLSSQIISRIRLGEHRGLHVGSAVFQQAPWLGRFVRLFETKPAFAGAFACALCLLLVFGIVNAERPDWQASAAEQPFAPTAGATSMAAVSPVEFSSSSSQPMLALNSTNPVLSLQPAAQPPVNALFGQPTPLVQEASFTPPGQ